MADAPPNALLTNTQRDFLDGAVEYSPTDSKGRTLRSRLRARVKAGIQDVSYLADPNRLADRDVDQLVATESDRHLLREGGVEMVAFVYRIEPDAVESVISQGLQRGVRRCAPEYAVDDVSININKRGQILDEARRRISENEPVSDIQIRAVLERGDMDPAELKEYVQSHPGASGLDSRREFRGP